ncbi:Dehydrogenase [Nesidiocoris tenuis]|uniref:Dehydrogenase n=1 Tax=Nesidiocoris tenuis TaxID=355587 RepID=A0ABN7BDP4_9HEMI|nr:Dehydrogenase [Nesidiocoris tenuis]
METLKEVVMVFLMLLMQKDEDGFKDSISTIKGTDILDAYDFVIVGGGSAGSTLANRLSEINEWKILLLEAGGQETDFTKTPAMYSSLSNTEYDWNYTTTKQDKTCQEFDGMCEFPRGRVLGGSSSTNAMIYTRGYRWDYDRWGKENWGWSFCDVEPYFLRSEGNRIPGLKGRGRDGPLTVDYPPYMTELRDQLIKAGQAKGLKNADCADYEYDCIFRTQTTIRDGRRCSASTAYLQPVSASRENLHILTGALVSKIIIENKVAKGVEFIHDDKVHSVQATKEVILSAGSINSPKILMLSGIGLRSHLESFDIPVIADLPVGDNLQDHNRVTLFYNVKNGSVANIDDLADKDSMDEYIANQTGPYAYTGIEVLAFVKRGSAWKLIREPPNIQHHLTTMLGLPDYLAAISTTVLRPFSRGTIRLSSADPKADPLIDVNYYGDKRDWQLTVEGMKFSNELFQTEPLTSYGASLNKAATPECAGEVDFLKYVDCVIKFYTRTMYHPVGTVKMASRFRGGVVNSNLQVYGIQNLRVIDASIAPTVISMNTNAMAIMIGEKGSDIIKSDHSKMLKTKKRFCIWGK